MKKEMILRLLLSRVALEALHKVQILLCLNQNNKLNLSTFNYSTYVSKMAKLASSTTRSLCKYTHAQTNEDIFASFRVPDYTSHFISHMKLPTLNYILPKLITQSAHLHLLSEPRPRKFISWSCKTATNALAESTRNKKQSPLKQKHK